MPKSTRATTESNTIRFIDIPTLYQDYFNNPLFCFTIFINDTLILKLTINNNCFIFIPALHGKGVSMLWKTIFNRNTNGRLILSPKITHCIVTYVETGLEKRAVGKNPRISTAGILILDRLCLAQNDYVFRSEIPLSLILEVRAC